MAAIIKNQHIIAIVLSTLTFCTRDGQQWEMGKGMLWVCASVYLNTQSGYTYKYIHTLACRYRMHTLLAWRLISVLSLGLSLTSLLTELLGQSILENDLSSICSCGSKNRETEDRRRSTVLFLTYVGHSDRAFFTHILIYIKILQI